MSRKKSAEKRLIEAIKELGLVNAGLIFNTLLEFNEPDKPVRHRKPKLVEATKA